MQFALQSKGRCSTNRMAWTPRRYQLQAYGILSLIVNYGIWFLFAVYFDMLQFYLLYLLETVPVILTCL